MKEKIKLVLIFSLILAVFLAFYLRKDKDEFTSKEILAPIIELKKIKPKKQKTITLEGRDYIQSPYEIGKYGGVFKTSIIGEGPKTFNPWVSKDATSSMLSGMMFDGLFSTDPYTGEVVGKLAKSFSVDGSAYVIRLRKGLNWSDGKPITADDVVFTFNEIVKKGFGNTSMRDNILVDGEFPSVEKVDSYTIKIDTKKPFAPFLRQAGVAIAPMHVLAPVVKQGKKAFNAFYGVTTEPKDFVTSGVFKLERYIPAQRVEFVRNPDYYYVDTEGNSLPYLEKYISYIVGDLNNEMLKFIAGEIDILSVRGNSLKSIRTIATRLDASLYNLGADTGTMFLSFNLNNRKNAKGQFYVEPVKQKWFGDKNFRKAIDYAVDRDALVLNILNGVGKPLFTAESLVSIYLNQKLKDGHGKNLEKAKKLLQESGFYLKKGELFDKKNNRVEFTLLTNAGNTEREYTGVMIKEDLEKLGIKVNFKPIEFNSLVNKLTNTFCWDAVIIGLTGSPLEPHGGKSVWTSSGSLHMFNQRKPDEKNLKLLAWEKELDELFEKGATELDTEKRKEIYNRYQELAYEQLPFIYLYSNVRIYAIKNAIKNLAPTPLGGMTHNIEAIWVE